MTPATVPYAKTRTELADLDEGRITRLVLDSEAWADVMTPILDKLDESDVERRKTGPQRSYSSHELEAVLLFQRVSGLNTYKAARDRLASDRHGETRKLLGLDIPRSRGNKVVRLTEGIPSEAAVSRHRQRFGQRRRHGAYERLFSRLVSEHLEDEDMKAEARILDLDGSHLLTRYRAEIPNSTRPSEKITCPDGGWVPPSKTNRWRTHGHGFNVVTLTTSTGIPLAKRTTKIHHSEPRAARELLERDFAREIEPKLRDQGLGVLTADTSFNSPHIRRLVRDLGLVENIQYASHAARKSSFEQVAKRNTTRIPIQGYPSWFANGHRELVCACGEGSVSRTFSKTDGKTTVRSQGRCKRCGSIRVTSGGWYLAKNAHGPTNPEFRRCQPGDEDRAEWAFGNPLTFNDPLSGIYGSGRFGHQEGFYGSLVRRFGILDHKGWYRTKAQAETDVTMTFCVMHVIAMEYRRRLREHSGRAERATEAAA